MHQVHVERLIDVPADKAWQIPDDFGGIYQYHSVAPRRLIAATAAPSRR